MLNALTLTNKVMNLRYLSGKGKAKLLLLPFLFCFLLSKQGYSANIYSIVGGDGVWGNAGNWSATSGGLSCGCTPVAGDDVYVEGSSVTITVAASPGVNFNSLTVRELVDGDNAALALNTGVTLNVDNGASGGDLNITDVAGGTGSPSVSLGGTSVLSIRGSVIINDGDLTANNITLNSTSTLKIGVDFDMSAGGQISILANSTVDYFGSGAQSVLTTTYGKLKFSGAGTKTFQSGTVQIKNNSITCFDPSGATTVVCTGATIQFNSTGAQTIPGLPGSSSYDVLTIGGSGTKTFANSPTINIFGTLTLSGTNTYVVGTSTINFNGTGNQTIPFGARTTVTYNDIQVNCTGGTGASLGSAVTSTLVAGNITVQSGTLNNGGFAIAGNAGKTFQVNNGATFRLTGSSGMPTGFSGAGTPVLQATSTVDFNGNGGQTIDAANYGNLTSSNTGARTLAAAGTIGVFTTFTPGTNVYTVVGSTINFNGTGNQSVPMPATALYNDILINCTGGTGATLAAAVNATNVTGNITVQTGTLNNGGFAIVGNAAKTFQVNNGATFVLSGTTSAMPTGFGTTTLQATSTVNFNGTGSQDVPAINFGNLTSSSTGGRVLAAAGTIGIATTFTPGTNIYTITGSTVNFNGTLAQSIPAFSFINLQLNNSAGASLTGSVNLTGVCTIGAGTLTTTGQTFTLLSTAAGTASIAAIPAGSAVTGNITMQRYSGSALSPLTDWRFLCSAVSGQKLSNWMTFFPMTGFTGATCNPGDCTGGCSTTCTTPSVYTYNEAVAGTSDNGYVSAGNITDDILDGKGYWVYLDATPVTFAVTGAPYQQAKSASLTYNDYGLPSDDGWNVVSNPYPSAIDWDALSDATHWTKTNIGGTIYIWNAATGSYASYATGAPVNGGTRYIASQQAYWVQATGAPALTVRELCKAETQNPNYLKVAKSPNTSQIPIAFKDFPVPLNTNTLFNSLKLTASTNAYPDDEIFIRFLPGASNNFDSQYDGWKLSGYYSNLSSVMNSLNYCINSLPDLTSDVTIPLRLTIPAGSGVVTYTISRDSILMLPMSSCIILEDKKTGSMTDLRTTVSYTFTISDTT
ncbi:MAG: hypothetical protein EPN85_12670, partial [Bacteroidetes bacterium]